MISSRPCCKLSTDPYLRSPTSLCPAALPLGWARVGQAACKFLDNETRANVCLVSILPLGLEISRAVRHQHQVSSTMHHPSICAIFAGQLSRSSTSNTKNAQLSPCLYREDSRYEMKQLNLQFKNRCLLEIRRQGILCHLDQF